MGSYTEGKLSAWWKTECRIWKVEIHLVLGFLNAWFEQKRQPSQLCITISLSPQQLTKSDGTNQQHFAISITSKKGKQKRPYTIQVRSTEWRILWRAPLNSVLHWCSTTNMARQGDRPCTTKSVKQWPHGQSASVTTNQPHIVPCASTFGCYLNQLRWIKLDRARAMDVLHTE